MIDPKKMIVGQAIEADGMRSDPSRYNYEVRIPKGATPEEIDEFMKNFKKKWFGAGPSEPVSKPEQA